MKVISRGIPPKEEVIKATCTSCKSVLEFTVGEAQRIADQRDGDYYKVTCPVCNGSVTRAVHPNLAFYNR